MIKRTILLILTLTLFSCTENNTTGTTINNTESVNDKSLQFTLTDLSGNEISATDYRGQWLIINYWATWCAPCRDEIPELIKFQKERDDVQILGIAYEDSEIEKLQNFVKDFDINYPILTIDVYNPPAFAEEGGLALPTTIVYKPNGEKHKKHMGPIDAQGLVELLSQP